jgi:hypothetical protein
MNKQTLPFKMGKEFDTGGQAWEIEIWDHPLKIKIGRMGERVIGRP